MSERFLSLSQNAGPAGNVDGRYVANPQGSNRVDGDERRGVFCAVRYFLFSESGCSPTTHCFGLVARFNVTLRRFY